MDIGGDGITDVSILITGAGVSGRCFGSQPRAKVSMMIMWPPAGTWTQQHAGFVDCCFGRLGFFQARRHREQLAGACDIGRAVAIGKQSVVADAVEAVRQDVDEKAADELVRAGASMTLYRARPSAR